MNRTFLFFFLLIFCVTVLSAETFRYVAPHVTAQPPWLNKVAVFNNGEAAADFTVIIRDTDGVIVFQDSYNVPGNSSLVLVLPTAGGYVPAINEVVLSPVEGSLIVETESAKVRPKAAFRYGDRQSLTEFFLQNQLAWEYILPNTVESYFSWTGLALFNPYDQALTVSLQAYLAGQLQDTREVEIGPQRKYVNLSFGVWPGIDYVEFDQVKIKSEMNPVPPPMSITGNDEQDRHVFFNGAITESYVPLEAGDLFATDSIVGDLMFVPAGTYEQGEGTAGDPCDYPEESPFTHTMTRNMAVMATEVTRQMWADLIGRQPTLPPDPTDTSRGSGMDNPVQRVEWFETILFANHLSVEQGLRPCYYWDEALTILIMEGDISWGNPSCDWAANGYRLPSEGEWERFCRAGTTTPFAVDEPNYTHCSAFCTPGDLPDLESIAWYCANQNDEAGNGTSKPVGMKDPNPWSLYDVHGNVREWCWDRWDYASPYPSGPVEDYRGLTSGSYRMLRGGSWDRYASDSRSAKRYANYPHGRSWRRGFRLCRTVN